MAQGIEYLQSREKRIFDFTGAFLAIAPSAAASSVAALALWREVDGPANTLFRQARPGRDGELLNVLKLRTINRRLTEGRPVELHGEFDPRAGSMGKFIRQLSADEFPQVWNILKGDMSLVGPRPLPQVTMDLYREADPDLFKDWHDFYSSVRPGLCGYSQMMRKDIHDVFSNEVCTQSMELDLQYAEEASMGTDIKVLMETPRGIARAAQNVFNGAALSG